MIDAPTKEATLRNGMAALREKLGVSGMIQFLQALGINRGNWTEERKEIFKDMTVDDIVQEVEQMRKQYPERFKPRPPSVP